MKLSSASRNELASIILQYPYRSGLKLIELFNDFCKEKDVYDRDFPSRIDYAKSKIDSLNGSEQLKFLIQEVFHLSNFRGDLTSLKSLVNELNAFFSKDGYVILVEATSRGMGGTVKTTNNNLAYIRDTSVSHEFVNKQIAKCRDKLSQSIPDIDGAITNARSLAEGTMEFALNELGVPIPKYDGNINALYKEVKKRLNLDPHKDLSDTFKEILSGLSSIVNGLGGLSNQLSDRHVRKYKPWPYHAHLAVNASFTLCEFLLAAVIRIKTKPQP